MGEVEIRPLPLLWGPIYKITNDNLTIMPKLQWTYDGRLIYQTSYEGCKAFLGMIHLR